MESNIRSRTGAWFLMAVASIWTTGIDIVRAQELLPDIVPWVREDAPYLVNWDISGNRLRMQTMFANIGDGLLQIRTDDAGTGGATTDLTQRVFSNVDNGPVFTDYFVNAALNFHAEHGHIHFDDFSEFQLLESVIDSNGIISVGNLVANTDKTSYRISDTARIPDPMYASSISYPSSNLGLYQNISVGHGDVYSHGTEGQNILLAGVPVGPLYWLRQIVDPTNVLREKNDSNNSFEILIDLNRPGEAILHLDGSFVQPDDLAPPVPGDLNGDRLIDVQDWIAFQATANTSLAGVDDYAALQLGDLNLDGTHTLSDAVLFRIYYETANGIGSFAAVVGVPEPSSLFLAGIGMSLAWLAASRGTNRRRVSHVAATVALAALVCLIATGKAVARVTLYLEDFEELTLGPNVDEALANPQAWTETPPTGWTVNDSGIPFNNSASRGVTEWKGWSFANKSWWVSAAGDQNRSQFSLGQGTVAIADPDEWDDKGTPINGNPFGGYFNALMTTPAISLAEASPNSAKLTFSSSWLPECCDDGPSDTNSQTAQIRISYNGGANFTQLMRWESIPASAFYKSGATNETVTLNLANPAGANSVVLEFGLLNAGNDWWWAIDNVEVFTPTVLEVNTDTGVMTILGAQNLSGYEITGPANSLNPAGWEEGNLDARNMGPDPTLSADFNNSNSVTAADYTAWRDAVGSSDSGDANGDGVTDQLDYNEWAAQFGQSVPEGQSWKTLIATDQRLFEFLLFGESSFESETIGAGYNTAIGAGNLSFTYSTSDGQEIAGLVRYVSNSASSAHVPEPGVGSMLATATLALLLAPRPTFSFPRRERMNR
jgi:hypothetical protein